MVDLADLEVFLDFLAMGKGEVECGASGADAKGKRRGMAGRVSMSDGPPPRRLAVGAHFGSQVSAAGTGAGSGAGAGLRPGTCT